MTSDPEPENPALVTVSNSSGAEEVPETLAVEIARGYMVMTW
jgi:hypothetical protein